MNGTEWIGAPVAVPDETAGRAARARQDRLTKPAGSLGRLETLAVRLAALQGRERPRLDRVRIVVFAADHGVAEEGVSAFPQAVTVEMIRNFARGGAAISVLARALDAALEVVDVGAAGDPGPLPGVVAARQGAGTANFTRAPAMTRTQLAGALTAGREAVARAREAGCDLFIAGEMGIANTTAASALTAALLGLEPAAVAGRGTGVDDAGLARKVDAIRRALALHGAAAGEPLEALRRLGGFEIAAIAGAYVACAQAGIPAVVDGFIASAAALAAVRSRPEVRPWLLFGHRSAEGAHGRILEALEADPILDLGMRLGEGTGAAAAVAVLRLACALHDGMATFDEAGVSEGAP